MNGKLKERMERWRGADTRFYDLHGPAYATSTINIDLTAIHDRFLACIPRGGLILDVGSGSGRDTLAFLSRGFRVEALEPSMGLAALSAKLTGVVPRVERAQDINATDRYDGVWACASLVHIPPHELPAVFGNLLRSARKRAPIYCSFKHGHGARIAADGRPFTDLNEDDLTRILSGFPEITRSVTWISDGEGSARGLDVWLNTIFSTS